MNILLDIGNTRIKWCVEQGEKLGFVHALTYRDINFIQQIQQAWSGLACPERLLIASVAKQGIVEQLLALADSIWPGVDVLIAKSEAQFQGMKNAYSEPSILGVDRWLALLALYHSYPANSCVVDCGSAITLDMLDEHGQHRGGVICPGLGMMKRSLFQDTAALPVFQKQYQVGLANSTSAAIYSGTLLAAAGVIEKTISEFGEINKMVLTGGDAAVIAAHLSSRYIIEPKLVLSGLALYGQGNRN